ncbi:MAG: glycosyltransferase family 4 protein [Bacillota bacterium]
MHAEPSSSSQAGVIDERDLRGRKATEVDRDMPQPPGLSDAGVSRKDDKWHDRTPRPQVRSDRGRRVDLRQVPPAAPVRITAAGKHIVILVENLPVPFDRRPWQIAQTLVRNGQRVSVICPRMYEYTQPYERLAGIDIYRYPNVEASTPIGWAREYLNALFWMSWVSFKLFVTQGIDAIHACNPPDLLFLVAWPFRVFFGVRFLFDQHDLAPEVYVAKFGRKDRLCRLLLKLEQMTYRLADVMLATNHSVQRLAITRGRIRQDRVFIVRNAPMPGRFTPGPGREELRLGRKHLVSYLGVMNRQDGLDLLLDSIHHVIHVRGRSDVAFAVIGDGPELPALKRRAAELGFDGQLHFVGRVSDGRILSDYLNTSALCVCPDPKNEMNDHSTMTKVVEYMALGKPIVAYDLLETRYSAAEAALYATKNDPRQFGDLIVQLLDDPGRRRTMGLAGQARYDALLCWRRSEEQLLAAYARLLGRCSAVKPV